MTPEMQAITQRLEEMEKQVAHLQALVTEQSDPDRTVAAQSFVVRDERGQRRAELGMVIPVGQTEAHPWLGLFDTNARVRACIGVEAEGPWFELYNAKGHAILEVREYKDCPRASLFDQSGQLRLLLTVSTSGQSNVLMYDGNSKLRLNLEADSAGSPVLVMHDGNAEPRFYIELSSMGHPGLVMRDATGKPCLRLSTDENGPTIGLFDVGGNQEAEVTPGDALLVTGGKHRIKLGMSSQSEFVAIANGQVSGEGSAGPKDHQNMPLLAFCDEDGRSTNFLILTANGPRLRLQDRQGNEVRLAVEYKTGEASLGIRSKDGKVIWSAP